MASRRASKKRSARAREAEVGAGSGGGGGLGEPLPGEPAQRPVKRARAGGSKRKATTKHTHMVAAAIVAGTTTLDLVGRLQDAVIARRKSAREGAIDPRALRVNLCTLQLRTKKQATAATKVSLSHLHVLRCLRAAGVVTGRVRCAP